MYPLVRQLMRLAFLAVLILSAVSFGSYVVQERRLEIRREIVSDPVIGYRTRPSVSVDGFSTDERSMRSDPAPAADDHCALRVVIFGDSVVFGFDLRDDELATTRLKMALEERLGWPVWVGNAASGGWSPNNIRGFVERFGWFQADMIGFVLNSHDIDQSLVIDPSVQEGAPIEIYRFRLVDLARHWLGLHMPFGWLERPIEADQYKPEQGAPKAEDVLTALFDEASRHGPTFVFHNRVIGELETDDRINERARRARPRAARLVSLVSQHDVGYHDLGPAMSATPGAYSDHIHLTATGQQVMADLMIQALIEPAADIMKRKSKSCQS